MNIINIGFIYLRKFIFNINFSDSLIFADDILAKFD